MYNVLAWFGLEYVEVHPESLQCTITALGLILNRKYLKLTFMLCLSLNLPSIQYKDKTDTNTNNSFIKSNSQELKYVLHFSFQSFPNIQKRQNNRNTFLKILVGVQNKMTQEFLETESQNSDSKN